MRRFDPRSIAGLVVWLRSDSLITLNGSTVSAWGNLVAGISGVSQGTAGKQPTYVAGSLPYLNCGISGQSIMTFPTSALASLTAAERFYVASNNLSPPSTGTGGGDYLGAAGGNDEFHPLSGSSNLYDTFAAADRVGPVALTSAPLMGAGVRYVYNSACGAGQKTISVNGILQFSGADTFQAIPAAAAIMSTASATNYRFGRMYEYLIYNRVLLATERAIVNAYCLARNR